MGWKMVKIRVEIWVEDGYNKGVKGKMGVEDG